MPAQQTHVGIVREWCVSLAVLTAISMSRQEAEMKLGAFVPLLMHDFPDAAFTADSLRVVARGCGEGFPTYPELANLISRWWRDNRPYIALPAPPAPPERAPPSPDEIAYVRARVAEIETILAASRARKMEPGTASTARHLTPEQLDIVNPLPGGRRRAPAPDQPDGRSNE